MKLLIRFPVHQKKSHNVELQSDEVNNEILNKRYISPKERQKIIDELKLT